jgi:hypothetical protein
LGTFGLDISRSGQGQLRGFCEIGNEISDYIKGGEFVENFSGY